PSFPTRRSSDLAIAKAADGEVMTRTVVPTAAVRRHAHRKSVVACLIPLAAVLLGAAAYAIDPTELPDPVLQQRYLALTHELRCVQCQNEAIADSPAGIASDLRREVRDMLLAGKS